jgi:hypothetical protein
MHFFALALALISTTTALAPSGVSTQETSIGRCSFWGSRPAGGSRQVGNVEIFGNVRQSGSRGNVTIWSGSGDIWVIYRDPRDVGRHQFRVSGNVQTCNNFR